MEEFWPLVKVMLEKLEICRSLFHGFDLTAWASREPTERLSLLPPAQEHVLKQDDGQARFVRAKLRVMVKRTLRKHGYPPDKQEAATKTVLRQAELFSEGWVS